jgi:hypothetical protein
MRGIAQEIMGYYPCPAEAVAMAAARLRAPRGPWSLVDPCAGEGKAVGQLAEALGCRPEAVHAVELDEGRGRALRENLPEARILAPASVLGCKATAGSFSLAWTNSPFDDEYGGGRTEKEFLDQVTPWIRPGGILALVCPERVVGEYGWQVRDHLLQFYERITVLPFPEGCRRFSEVVTLAVKRRQPVASWTVKWEDAQAPEGHAYAIPAGGQPRRFEKVELTDLEVSRALAASPLRRRLLAPPAPPLPSPPLALGTGHIALLLASGHLDGAVSPEWEAPHVVRGQARKVEYVASVEEKTDAKGKLTQTTTVLRERIKLVVRAVGPNGEIRTFEEK